MLSNRSMPRCTVIPEIPYPDPAQAAEWLCNSFGFTVRLRIANHRIQLNVGDCALVLTASRGEIHPQKIMVRVENVDAHHERADRNGAQILHPPQTWPYGERQYSALDPTGHHWTFSQSVADINPADWGGEPVDL